MRWMLAVLPLAAAAQSVTFQASLPLNLFNPRLARDSAGRVFISGSVDGSVYAAQLNPDDFSPVWEKRVIPGNAAGMAVTADGSIFLAVSPTAPGPGSVMRLDARGNLVYAMSLGGAVPAYVYAIAANARGEAVITGVRYPSAQSPESFTAKINPQGTGMLWSTTGTGSGAIALDAADNVYLLGTAFAPGDRPATPGAFQTTFTTSFCGSGMIGFPCARQFVAKLRPDGALAWSTFLTGGHSETPGGIAVDASGAVYVAGSTTSIDYPVTPGAFQTEFRSRVPPAFRGSVRARNAYVTKLAPDGARLVWSSYVGGSGADTISALRLDGAGDVLAGGSTTSPDFPALAGMPERCQPRDEVPGVFYGMEPWPGVRQRAFVTALRPDGSGMIGTELLAGYGATVSGLWEDAFGVLAAGPSSPRDAQGTVRAENAFAARIGWSGAGCLVDPADYASVNAAGRGQFITFFGSGGDAVAFSGTPAELLYASGGQVNVRVPDSVTSRTLLEVTQNGRIIDRRILPVLPRVPALFVVPDFYTDPMPPCPAGAVPAIALNEDGSANSCTNPAAPGSLLTVFVNGAGTDEPPPDVEVLLNRQPVPARYAGNGRIEVRLPEDVRGGALLQVAIHGAVARPGFASVSIR